MAAAHRKRWWLAIFAVMAVTGIGVAAVWGIGEYRERAALRADCVLVTQLADKWTDVLDAGRSGDAKPKDWAAISSAVRGSAPQLSDSSMRPQMDRWADGIDMLVKVYESEESAPSKIGSPLEEQRTQQYLEASSVVYQATAPLHRTCPEGWPEDQQQNVGSE